MEIVFKCTRALEFAHRMGITHRDLKPANILHSGETDVKISDFGVLVATGDRIQVARSAARVHVPAAGEGAPARPSYRHY